MVDEVLAMSCTSPRTVAITSVAFSSAATFSMNCCSSRPAAFIASRSAARTAAASRRCRTDRRDLHARRADLVDDSSGRYSAAPGRGASSMPTLLPSMMRRLSRSSTGRSFSLRPPPIDALLAREAADELEQRVVARGRRSQIRSSVISPVALVEVVDRHDLAKRARSPRRGRADRLCR